MWTDRVREFLKTDAWQNSADWRKTSALTSKICSLRQAQSTTGLDSSLFNEIVDWKLRSQRKRTEHHRVDIPHKTIAAVTALAFSVEHPDPKSLMAMQCALLMSLPGVGVGLASAILTLYFPERYGIIDFRVWDEIHEVAPGQQPLTRTFGQKELCDYVGAIQPLAKELQVSPQVVDFALWSIWGQRRAPPNS